jgi:hypothetical protein
VIFFFENEWHLFLGCHKAKMVWEEVGLWHIIEGMIKNNRGQFIRAKTMWFEAHPQLWKQG